ncbi:MAG: hypothetical protein AUH85_03085 [Chloroflexi bacterium 13_1_40CM_4_68_4]|nr:MAG: hypothetical protein AUH85_03085 [Chloroflexi bacterium 13_1_40CM_4_68_4]
MRALQQLRDPVGFALAAITGAAIVALQEGIVVAAICAVAVLAFRVVAGVVAERGARAPVHVIGSAEEPFAPLTRKQIEIAELVAEGMTNREIAERLVLSERTIDNHVFHIMNKLNVHRRTEIGVWIVERRIRANRTRPPAQ